jgi:hypothetical protein
MFVPFDYLLNVEVNFDLQDIKKAALAPETNTATLQRAKNYFILKQFLCRIAKINGILKVINIHLLYCFDVSVN